MVKNLRIKAIGIIILSALLFILPIGAILGNRTMVTEVRAEDTPIVVENTITDNSENKNEEGKSDSDESGEEKKDESTDNTSDTNEDSKTDGEKSDSSDTSGGSQGDVSGNDTDGDSDSDDTENEKEEEEHKVECTCTEHCTSNYNYDATCAVCEEDFKKCEYVNPNVSITITAPTTWSNEQAKVTIGVRDVKKTGNFEVVKIEAKIGQNGSWQDITEEGFIEITENCSVYVQVTDQNGKVYSKNKSIRCIDKTNPTLNAAVSNGLLTVTGHDNESGLKAFYINGYEFTDFTNNTLNVRLQQFDAGYEYFTVQAMDNAGNMSEVYKTKNPYYDDDPSDDDDKGKENLPADATASNPSSATATVTDHTKTDSSGNTTYSSRQEAEKHAAMAEADAAEKAEAEGDDANENSEEAETGKEFYTIQTQSEKIFYLIIDRDGEEEKVYFLTEIDENDLMNTVSTTSETLPKNSAALESAIPTDNAALDNNNVESEVTVSDATVEEEEPVEEEPVEEEPEIEEPKKQSGAFTYIFLGIIGASAIGIWYYLKMVKGKKEDFLDEDDEEEDDDEEYYESDDDNEGGGEDDFFNMDDDESDDDIVPVRAESTPDDLEDDVTETIDEE